MPPCLTLSIIRYGSRVKWRNPGKGVASFPTPWCSSYWKRCLRVTLDYGRQLYLLIYIYIYIFNSWNVDCEPVFHGVFFLQNNNHQAVKNMEWIENRKIRTNTDKNRWDMGFRLCVVVSVWVYVDVCVCVYVL